MPTSIYSYDDIVIGLLNLVHYKHHHRMLCKQQIANSVSVFYMFLHINFTIDIYANSLLNAI